MIKLEYEQWVERYKPVINPLNTNAAYEGYMFETYNGEMEMVKATDRNKIWTLIHGDNDNWWIINGWHFVNRFGYFITELPWEDETIEVNLNELITVGDARAACVEFMEEHLGITLSEEKDDILYSFFLDKF